MTEITEEPSTALLKRVRDLLPTIRDRADESERLRSIPKESARDLIDAGLARMLVPERFGGMEADLATWVEVVTEIGTADASHAWCASLLAHHPHYIAQFPEAAQQAVWADGPDVSIAGPFTPVMEVDPVEDGYILSGTAAFASGVNHSTWIIVGGMLAHGNDEPEWTLFLAPPGSFEIRDTWHTVGMCGTGSNSVVLRNVFVAADHTLRVADLREGTGPGAELHPSPIYRTPWLTYNGFTFVAPMLGAALGALEDFCQWNRNRASMHGSSVSKYISIQRRVAEAGAQLDAARLLTDRAMSVADAPQRASLELRARAGRDGICASQLIVSAMETIMGMSGAAGFASTNRIQRAWRDVHFASSHVLLNPEVGYPVWGRHQFGLERDPETQWY
ncbi:acyl-CoA dehydrogenase family protein [Nocardia nova]|uniref:acyl-CoA dehydrogenase family protein n=1 Tax=Nocardia nova TaxID=37330 RepID=UPI0033CFE5EB